MCNHFTCLRWKKYVSVASSNAQFCCSPECDKSLLLCTESPSIPNIVSKGFPPLTQFSAACVFFFHVLCSEEEVSHYSSFLRFVTTIIVAGQSPQTQVSFWVCDISWWPPKTHDLCRHTHTDTLPKETTKLWRARGGVSWLAQSKFRSVIPPHSTGWVIVLVCVCDGKFEPLS